MTAVLVQPARLQLALLDPQVARELRLVSANLLDEALGATALEDLSAPHDPPQRADGVVGVLGLVAFAVWSFVRLKRMKGLEPSTFCMARTIREVTGDDRSRHFRSGSRFASHASDRSCQQLTAKASQNANQAQKERTSPHRGSRRHLKLARFRARARRS